MAEVDRLTLEIEDKASSSSEGIDNLITKLEKLSSTISKVNPKLTKLSTGFTKLQSATAGFTNVNFNAFNNFLNQLNQSSANFNTITQNIKNTTTAVNQLNQAYAKYSKTASSAKNVPNLTPSQQQGTNTPNTSAMNKLSRAVNFTALTAGAYKAGRAFSKLLGTANDYIETQNLFDVVMGDSTRQAWNYVQSLESIGVNQEEAMRYQSSFYDLANSLGVSSKNAYTLSEQFTKLAYDYASLYNMDPDVTFQKLQAGIIGTVKPLRGLGKDVSEVRLQETARRLGINASVRDMTQAQKTELRFIAIMEQSKSAMNDMERTIDQPANALRVLRAQLTSLAREFGSLFIPALSAVLPYLIAFIKFIRTLVTDIAGFFGVKLKAIDFSGVNSQINNTAKGTGDTANNLKKSADNAKKLKDYILGIDELNVLNEDGTTSRNTGKTSTGKGSVGDLGLDLSDYGYDTLLDNVNSKADEIYKTFMKWKTPLAIAAGILAGLWTIGAITNFIRALKGVQTTSNLIAGVQGIGGLARAFFDLAGTGGVLGTVATAFVGLGDTILTSMGIITGSTVVAGLTGLGVVLAGVGLVALAVHHEMQPAVQQIDELEGVSDKAKKKLEPFLETWKSATKTLTKIDMSGLISDKDIDTLQKKAKKMHDAVTSELDSDKNEELKNLSMMKGLKNVTEEEYNELLNSTNSYYENTTTKVEEAQAQINEITEKYRGKNIEMTQEDKDKLTELYNQIGEAGVTAMSESEQEQTKILNRLKYNQTTLTIEAGSEMLVEAKKNHDKSIQEAEDYHATALANLEKRYDNGNGMTKEEYDKQKGIIDKAYNEMVSNADTKYNDINTKVKSKLGDQARYIDDDTGKIKSKWQIHWEDMKTTVGKAVKNISKTWDGIWGGLKTWSQDFVDGFCDTFNTIGGWLDQKVKDLKKTWNGFWKGLDAYKKQFKFTDPTTWISWSSMDTNMGLDIPVTYYGTNSMQNPTVTAFARGGFVPANASFVSPNQNLWTAGEAGRELVGNYNGRTTVMPLEDTGFVEAIYQATREAVISAMSQTNRENPVRVESRVYLDSREIKSAVTTQDVIQANGFIKRR